MADALASFDSQLQAVLNKKPPISASTTAELTKLASELTVRTGVFTSLWILSSLWLSLWHENTNLKPTLSILLQPDLVSRLVTKIQNFFQTSPKSYRLSALYLIDSICKSKNDLKPTYIDAFSGPLPSLIATFLKDASDKEEVRFLPIILVLHLIIATNLF